MAITVESPKAIAGSIAPVKEAVVPLLSNPVSQLKITDSSPQGKAVLEAEAAKNKKLSAKIFKAVKENDDTALKEIIEKTPKSVVKSLVNAVNKHHETPLIRCCYSKSVACLKLLLDAGADPFYVTPQKNNFLHYAATTNADEITNFIFNVYSDSDEFNKLLLGINVNGDTPLLTAVTWGSVACFKLLLKNGAVVTHINVRGFNVMHLAAGYGHPEIIRYIIEKVPYEHYKTMVNAPNNDGESPLLLCANSKSTACMAYLLRAKADPGYRNPFLGENFVHRAAFVGDPDLLWAFLTQIPQKLITGLVNAGNKQGDTPLFYCCESGHIPCLDHLLRMGANPLVFNQHGVTPYEMALVTDQQRVAQALIRKEPMLEGCFALKLLGHVFGFVPHATIGGVLVPTGGSYDLLMYRIIGQNLATPKIQKDYFSVCTSEQYQKLTTAFNRASKAIQSDTEFEETAKAITEGKLVILGGGWKEHAVALVFYHGYLVICNRGRGCIDEHGRQRTFLARRVNLSKVSSAMIRTIMHHRNSPSDVGIQYFYTELLQSLDAQEDAFCLAMTEIAPKPSKVGVCSYAACKAALRASLALLTGHLNKPKKASKAWATQHRETILRYFIVAPSPLDPSSRFQIMDVQAGRLSRRIEKQIRYYFNRLENGIKAKQPLGPLLDDLEYYCDEVYRKALENCLVSVCGRDVDTSDPEFGRKKFVDPDFDEGLKLKAINQCLRHCFSRY